MLPGCESVYATFQLLKHLTDFHETWQQHHFTEETLKSHFLISCSLQEVVCSERLHLSDSSTADGRAVQLCFVYLISFVKFQLRTQCSCELNFLFGDK
jgi:hypothetical protein